MKEIELRDLFAAFALMGMIAKEKPEEVRYAETQYHVEAAYFYADAMLTEREVTKDRELEKDS